MKKYLGNETQYYQLGDRKVLDANGDGIISDGLQGDRIYGCSSLPLFHGGFLNQITWKNFIFTCQFHFQTGQHIINARMVNSVATYVGHDDESVTRPILARPD